MLSLTLTLGVAILSAAVHAPALAWLASAILMSAAAQVPLATPSFAIAVLLIGAATAWFTAHVGARRAKTPYGAADMLPSLGYWSLLTLAFMHALWRLIVEPHTWDKTPHIPDQPALVETAAAQATGRQAA